jgi:hypothetical protein
MAVIAFKNGEVKPRAGVMESMQDKSSGLAVVRFDKPHRTITFECWPFLADVTKPGTQFPGWPVTVSQFDNYGRKAVAHLPTLEVNGTEDAVVQVVNEATGEIEYTVRIDGTKFQPKVFAKGTYTVKVSDPESGRAKELKGIEAVPGNKPSLVVGL